VDNRAENSRRLESTRADRSAHKLSVDQELKTDDGQVLYVKKLERKAKEDSQPQEQIESKDSTKSSARRKRLGCKIKIKAIKVVVQNLERSRWFYQDILGLKIARESKTLVNFGELFTLVSHDHGGDVESFNKQNAQTQAILCLECSDIQSSYGQKTQTS
jgi:hypothetical protein